MPPRLSVYAPASCIVLVILLSKEAAIERGAPCALFLRLEQLSEFRDEEKAEKGLPGLLKSCESTDERSEVRRSGSGGVIHICPQRAA